MKANHFEKYLDEFIKDSEGIQKMLDDHIVSQSPVILFPWEEGDEFAEPHCIANEESFEDAMKQLSEYKNRPDVIASYENAVAVITIVNKIDAQPKFKFQEEKGMDAVVQDQSKEMEQEQQYKLTKIKEVDL